MKIEVTVKLTIEGPDTEEVLRRGMEETLDNFVYQGVAFGSTESGETFELVKWEKM